MKIEAKNVNYKKRVEEKFVSNKLSHHLGIRLSDITVGKVTAIAELHDFSMQQDGIAHGGLCLTIADVAAGFAAYSIIGENERVVTAELKYSFFRPGKADKIKSVGRVVKPGKAMIFCESDLYAILGETETLIGRATTIMAVI